MSVNGFEMETSSGTSKTSLGLAARNSQTLRRVVFALIAVPMFALLALFLINHVRAGEQYSSTWKWLDISRHTPSFLFGGMHRPPATVPLARPVGRAVPAIPTGSSFLGQSGVATPLVRYGARVRAGHAIKRDRVVQGATTHLAAPPAARSGEEAEAKLMDILSEKCPKKVWMHLLSERTSSAKTANGDPSVPALLDFLEGAKPPPETFDRTQLEGDWLLEYTNDLPTAVRKELAQEVENATTGISVVLSISSDGSMETNVVISLRHGVRKALTLHSSMSQIEHTPRFLVIDRNGDDEEVTTNAVTYLSDGLLVVRKDLENQFYEIPELNLGLMAPKTDLWRKIEQPPTRTWSVAHPYRREEDLDTNLWRFQVVIPTIRSSGPGFFRAGTPLVPTIGKARPQFRDRSVVATRALPEAAINSLATVDDKPADGSETKKKKSCSELSEAEVKDELFKILVTQEPDWVRFSANEVPKEDIAKERERTRKKKLEKKRGAPEDKSDTWDPKLYPYHPKIHTLGNHGLLGKLHAEVSPGFTYMLDRFVYGADVRKTVLTGIGENKTVLDIACGTGFSTSGNPGSLGVDTSAPMVKMAQRMFPYKRFQQAHAEQFVSDKVYDVVTIMYLFHEAPREARKEILRNMRKYAKEQIIIVDICPGYTPSKSMLDGEPYILDYLEHIREDLAGFKEEVLIENHVHMWTLQVQSLRDLLLDDTK